MALRSACGTTQAAWPESFVGSDFGLEAPLDVMTIEHGMCSTVREHIAWTVVVPK
jgi:hypothetical protein